jgi:hypothetical protein
MGVNAGCAHAGRIIQNLFDSVEFLVLHALLADDTDGLRDIPLY